MAMPPNRSYPDKSVINNTSYIGTVSPPATRSYTVIKCRSSRPAKPVTPFKYRIKRWLYKGRVYERLSGWVYPPKKKRLSVQGSKWRQPLAYSCSLEEGDVTNFNGCYSTKGNPADKNDHSSYSEIGALSAVEYHIACPALPSYTTGLESRAVVKALSKLKDQKVNLAVAMAERTETAELLVGTLAGLAKAARSLSRGNMRGVARGLGLSGSPKAPKGQTFHQKWLELQYGWQPLYQDVFGAVSALHQADQDDPKRYMQTVTAKVRDKYSRTNKQSYNYCYGTFTKEDFEEGAFVRLDYYLENPLLASLSALGITNPAEVVWERVPFSFVADWFIPVGNYLSAMDAALGYKFRAGSLSRIVRRKWYGQIHPTGPQNGYWPNAIYGTVNVRQLKLDRTIYSSSPLPRIPSFKNPFPQGSTHIANAIALFASSLRH